MNHDFRWRRMAQKAERTGSARVGAGLKHHHEIADFDVRYGDCAAQRVQWCAQRPNYFDRLLVGFTPLGCNGNGEISFDGLSKVSRCRQMMVHPAIENYELLSARHFDIEDAGQIDACLGDQVPARLNHQAGSDE